MTASLESDRLGLRATAALVGATLVFLVAATVGSATPAPSRDYGSAELVQLGYGPGGPSQTAQRSPAAASREYGSATLLQLGYGPAGPPEGGR